MGERHTQNNKEFHQAMHATSNQEMGWIPVYGRSKMAVFTPPGFQPI